MTIFNVAAGREPSCFVLKPVARKFAGASVLAIVTALSQAALMQQAWGNNYFLLWSSNQICSGVQGRGVITTFSQCPHSQLENVYLGQSDPFTLVGDSPSGNYNSTVGYNSMFGMTGSLNSSIGYESRLRTH